MKTYTAQPGHVINLSGGKVAEAGEPLQLSDDEAQALGAAVQPSAPAETAQAAGPTEPA